MSFHCRLYKRKKVAFVIPKDKVTYCMQSLNIYPSECAQTAEQTKMECFKFEACLSCAYVRGIIYPNYIPIKRSLHVRRTDVLMIPGVSKSHMCIL